LAWTDPRTWVDSEFVTASIMNQHVRDNLNAMGPHLLARKTSDQSVTSSTALQSDSELVTPTIEGNEVWYLRLLLRCSGSASGNLKASWQFPTGGNLGSTPLTLDSASGALAVPAVLTSSDGSAHSVAIGTTTRLVLIEVSYANGGTSGAVTFRWAQVTSNATPTIVRTNSTLWGVKLA
jgi:hypothetical protein